MLPLQRDTGIMLHHQAVDNQENHNPHLNLALEEFALHYLVQEEPLLLFYINDPSVILGRNQNVLEEVDLGYLAAHGIPVVRRLSGGGAVYHDSGNLNFSMMMPGQGRLHDFAYFTSVAVKALNEFGLQPELRNRSSLFFGSRKISGNAQYATRGRLIHHGTLLFDTDLEAMLRALNPGHVEIESRAVQSVRSSVVNLRELLAAGTTLADVREAIARHWEGGILTTDDALSPADWDAVRQLADERYRSWEWTFGRSPRFTMTRQGLLNANPVGVTLTVDRGQITALEFAGAGPDMDLLQQLAQILIGLRFDPPVLRAAIVEAQDLSMEADINSEAILSLVC